MGRHSAGRNTAPPPFVDLRSDTVTRPTPEMRQAMYQAEVGDDVIGDDPTVKRLEALGAEMLGKEASLFVPSGTFGNQLALFTHCARGSEVILPENSHIVQHEAGAAAVIAAVQLRTFRPAQAAPRWEEFDRLRRTTDDIHYPPTALVEYENATSAGEVAGRQQMAAIFRGASGHGIPVHVDGARIFNAAVALGLEAAELACHASSIMFCLSKGLGAPVGSLLAGTREFISAARRKRKIMGGGMRQAGVLAAPGIVALQRMTLRLEEDHAHAAELAAAFRATGAFEISPDPPQINMFFLRFSEQRLRSRAPALVESLKRRGVLSYPPEGDWVRLVTHHDVSGEQIRHVCSLVEECVEESVSR